MTTVAEVMTLALKDANALGEGETASAAMTSDAFATFQQMLAMWQIDNLFVYAQVSSSFAPTGATSYTVGTAGTIAITRPDKIDYAFWRSGTTDTPIEILSTYEEYQSIASKTLAGDALYAFYLPSYTLGTLYLYPQPSTGTVHLVRQERLPSLTATSDTVTLPPQYIMPIRFSLAEIYSVVFQTPLPPGIPVMAARARETLRRSNLRIEELSMPEGLPRQPISSILFS